MRKLPPGIWKRGDVYWSRFRVGGKLIRKRLSKDFRTACELLSHLKSEYDGALLGLRDTRGEYSRVARQAISKPDVAAGNGELRCYYDGRFFLWNGSEYRSFFGPDHVYFVAAMLDGVPYGIKIGSAQNVSERIKNLQTGSPLALNLLAHVEFGGIPLEQHLHGMFKRARIHSEWYQPVSDLVALVTSIKAHSRRAVSTSVSKVVETPRKIGVS